MTDGSTDDGVDPRDVLAWRRGELDDATAREFERRLDRDHEFRARALEFAEQDAALTLLVRRATRRTAPQIYESARASRTFRHSESPSSANVKLRRLIGWKGVAAAAAVLAACFVALLRRGAPDAPFEFEVATLASESAIETWQMSLGFDPESFVPVGREVRDDRPAPPRIPAAEFVLRTTRADEARAAVAIATEAAVVRAPYFRIPVRVTRSANIVVIDVDARGRARRLWPEGAELSAPLAPGILHVLPGHAVQSRDDGTLSERVLFNPGFLVEIGAGRLDVLVAVRAGDEPLERRWLDEVDARTARGESKASLALWLRAEGFEVRCLMVEEP